MKTLPDDSKARAQYPIASGCLAYFPAAIAGVARHSFIGGAKYNDGGLVHLRWVSNKHLDCVGRHLLDLQDLVAMQERGTTHVDTRVYNFETKTEELINLPIEEAILIECNALAWRALAVSQTLHEQYGGKPLAPAARIRPVEDTSRKIHIVTFQDGKRVSLIRALRQLLDLSLKDSKDFTETLPKTIDTPNGWSVAAARARLTNRGARLAA